MKRLLACLALTIATTAPALADASTTATAGRNNAAGTGSAAATARYDAPIGFANTQTHSGPINAARGVAVEVDKNGITLSVSNAIATKNGPAIASTFNLAINRDGDVSRSGGISVSRGPIETEASAGGSAATGPRGGSATTTASASGRSDRFGTVEARTASHTQPARRGLRVERDDDRKVRILRAR
jgi:hypothetical protein